jgi:hypothetical protein
MKKNINLKKNKYLIVISTLILIVGGYLLSTNNQIIKNINLSKVFSSKQAEAVAQIVRPNNNYDPNNPNDPYGYSNVTTITTTKCNNGASNPPRCTLLNGTCIGGENPSTGCPTVSGAFSKTYLPMAANGLALTAGMVQTSVNVDDARTKYLAGISETNSIKKELKNIAIEYNQIIEDAQLKRNQKLGTGLTNQCTFSELIQYQQS